MTAMALRNGALVLILLLAAAPPAAAETLSLKADLAPVAGAKSKAAGALTATYDTGSKKLTWQGTYRGIGSYATAASMHAPDGAIVVRLRSFDSPFEGTAIVSETQAPDLVAGRWYLVVSTADFPDGELRGTLAPAQ